MCPWARACFPLKAVLAVVAAGLRIEAVAEEFGPEAALFAAVPEAVSGAVLEAGIWAAS